MKRPNEPRSSAFRKYTNLAIAIDMLQRRQITLLDPSNWDDKNDAWFMSEFKDILGASTVLATCIAETNETYHHWRVFSPGMDGVCIELDKDAVISAFEGMPGIRKGQVRYRKIDTLRKRDRIDVEELPFLKRSPYEPECEYRIVYVEKGKDILPAKSFPIQIEWIKRLTLSPWMPPELRRSVVKTLKSIDGCKDLSIVRSTLVSNRDWRALTAKAR